VTTAHNARIRTGLGKALRALERAHERIQSARERDPDLCRGFRGYGGVRTSLEQARGLLERETYRVAMAGMMSAGKSTLANALLRRPGLLPTGIEETTLTITLVRSPGDGHEGLAVHYLSYEDALQGIFQRGHYVKFFPPEVVERVRAGADAEEVRGEVRRLVESGEMPDDVRDQLAGFLEALEQRRHLLGTTIHPSLDERRAYLAPRTHRDVGHLLLIARAEVFVRNDLFDQEGIEFVDLPGADSTNERQQRIAFEYLQDTDLLLAIPNAAGFRFVDIDVLARFRQARGAIRDRVFFVLNRFDEAKISDLDTEDASLSYFKKIVDMLARDYDPGNLFFTVGLWAQLEERQVHDVRFGPEERRALERVEQTTRELVDHLLRQGVVDRVEREWNERYARRLGESIRALVERGGVDRLRRELTRYLKAELELARLREVKDLLQAALRSIEDLVDPERERVRGFLDSAREQIRATGAFLEQVSYQTRAALESAHGDMAARRGEVDEARFQALVRRLGEQFEAAIEGVLAEDNDLIDMRALAAEVRGGNTGLVMQRVIDEARAVLSGKFVDLLTGRLAADFARLYREALEPLDNERALSELGRAIERPDLGRRYAERLEALESTLRLVTRLRALEETWAVGRLDFTPAPGGKPFAEVEARFRRALIDELKGVYGERFRALGAVLLKHYRVVLDDFLREFEEITAESLHEVRLQGAVVPVELLVARASPEERRRYGLAELARVADSAREAVDAVVAELEAA